MSFMIDGWLGALMGPGKNAGRAGQPPKRKRGTPVSGEIISHYEDLMNSGAFLYAFLDFNGAFLMMNQGMRAFWGRLPAPESILACCSDSEVETMCELLRDARSEPVAALIPMSVGRGGPLWMDVELSPAEMMGAPVIQLVGVNVTDWAALRESVDADSQKTWTTILDCCPGLLCCVVDRQGKLLYSSQGYRAIASRVFGHDCNAGDDYPPTRTKYERELYDVVSAARHGRTSNVEIEENEKDESKPQRKWDFTAAPLRQDGNLSGAVLRVLPSAVPERKLEPEPEEKPAAEERHDAGAPVLSAFLDATAAPAAVVDGAGVCLAANALFLQSFNNSENVTGLQFLDMIPADTPANSAVRESFQPLLLAGEGKFECRLPAGEGEVKWMEVYVRPLELNGEKTVMLTCRDSTMLRRTQEQLQRVRETDYTTGLLNRQGLERLLERETRNAVFDMTALSLLILDIDGFRKMNETRGYAAADHALKMLASIMKGALSAGDVMGRWGGDEFMILTPRSSAAARLLGNSLREAARSGPFGREFALTLSVGVAEFSMEMDVSALVASAYDAMVSAKHSGGDRTVVSERHDAGVDALRERIDGIGTDTDYR